MANDDQPKMKAVQWYGKEDFRLNECPKPTLKESKDVIRTLIASSIQFSSLRMIEYDFFVKCQCTLRPQPSVAVTCISITTRWPV